MQKLLHIQHLYFLGERLRRRERVAADEARKNKLAELQDLIHLEGELSEDSVVRALQTRFFNQKYFVSMIDTMVVTLGFDSIFDIRIVITIYLKYIVTKI